MRKHITGILCALLALVFVLSGAPIASATAIEPDTRGVCSEIQTNPLYDNPVAPQTTTYSRKLYSARESTEEIAEKCTEDYSQLVAALTKGMENRESTITLYYATKEPMFPSEVTSKLTQAEYTALLSEKWANPLFENALAETDCPTQGDSLRWAWNKKSWSFESRYDKESGRYCYKTVFSVFYYTTKDQEDQLTEAVTDVIDSFQFTADTTDAEKVATIYDYITKNVTYDYANLEDDSYGLKYTAYAALINKTAVCQGFSLLYYRMAEMCGIDTRIISGYAKGPHAWNISRLGCYYYNLDATWDAGESNYRYFLKGSSGFPDHYASEEYTTSAFTSRHPISQTHYTKDSLTHDFTAATCTAPMRCKNCGFTIGKPLGHDYTTASCTKAKTCKVCNVSSGKELGHAYTNACDTTCNRCKATRTITHSYSAATCTAAKTCSVCGIKDGKALGHKWTAATCIKAKTCKVCGVTSGNKLGHTYTNACDKTCNRCKASRTITHNYSAATCTKAKTCKVCGTVSGSKLGHTYTNACDKSCNRCKVTRKVGTHKYTNSCDTACNVCKAKRSITHKYKTTVTKATLKKNGSVVKKCTVCSKVASNKVVKYAKTFKLSATSYTYNKKVKTPTVTVKDSAGKTLKKNVDYTVTYSSGRKNVGTYKVTIKLKGNYSGTKTLTFKIVPKAASINKLTAAKKALTVKLNRQTVQSTGYQIQYSTSKSFSSAKTTNITSNKTSTKTVKSLKAKTTYYVRVRTYKTVSGTKIYSNWSSMKYMKTK